MPRRSRAREVALQVLFQDDLHPQNNPAAADEFLVRRLRQPPLVEFARELVTGVRRNRADLDRQIAEVAAHWTLTRMAVTDRNVLRLGAFELLHTETPDRVVVNEAVDLAKRYGSVQSGPFVNGILDRLMHPQKTAAETSSSPAADP